MSDIVRDFLVDVAENLIISGKPYSLRIELDDGLDNSYIGFDVDTDGLGCKEPTVAGLRLYRHTNCKGRLDVIWKYELGNICNPYIGNKDIPLFFGSYGKTQGEAEAEAVKFFKELKRIIKKKTAEIKLEAAKSAEEERERLLARLSELEGKS